jgi:Tfp pilus assembly protein FimT
MATISVMLLILSFAAPSLTGILKGKKQDQAVAALEAILEGARMESVTQNTYVWVAFKNCAFSDNPPTPSGEDEVWVMAFRGRSGENKVTLAAGSQMMPVGTFRRLTGVNFLTLDRLPEALRNRLQEQSNQTALKGDVMVLQPSQFKVNWAGNIDTGPVTFDRVLRFTPRGEVMWEHGMEGVSHQGQPYFTMGVARTMRGSPLLNDGDVAAVLLGGFTGRVSVLRP